MLRKFARGILGTAAFAVVGCAGTYDLVTSQRFKERPFHTLFTSEDPMQVLETVEVGDDRVRAMQDLKEPRKSGGTDAQQDRAIAILQASATTDRRPMCRLAAVAALSRFDDPRVGPILIAAYRNASLDNPLANADVTPAASFAGVRGAISTFTPDTVTGIQSGTLEALGRHKSPEGLSLLVTVAAGPGEAKPKGVETVGLSVEAGISEMDRFDVRLAAIRALGNYDKDPTAIQTLVGVLKVEKDVALRGRAHDSLVKISGQDLPPDASAWADWMAKGSR